MLLKAVAKYPDGPLLLSYYGRLQAIVDKKFRSGIAARTRATLLLKKEVSFSEEVLYQVFYLNRAERASPRAGKRMPSMRLKRAAI